MYWFSIGYYIYPVYSLCALGWSPGQMHGSCYSQWDREGASSRGVCSSLVSKNLSQGCTGS